MQMRWGLHRFVEEIGSMRNFAAERQAMRDEWAEDTEGAVLPALEPPARWR